MFSSVGLLNISSKFSKARVWQKAKLALPSIFLLIFKSKCIKGNLIHMFVIHLHLTHQKYCLLELFGPQQDLGASDTDAQEDHLSTHHLVLYTGVMLFFPPEHTSESLF